MPDGTYKITGQKIFITYGEHDLTENIIHLVLARLPDAPPGTRGISLFLVPKFLLNADGSPGARNDVRAHTLEHKLGIHGSPTCTMILGDNGGATGYLIGEENRGMACMFTMMNAARLATAIQGVSQAELALQLATAYARERKQGFAIGAKESSPIIAHPDVKRMLATMRTLTGAARAICYSTAVALDLAAAAQQPAVRTAAADAFAAWLSALSARMVAAGKPAITVRAFDTNADAIQAIVSGQADAAYLNDPQAAFYINTTNSGYKLAFTGYASNKLALATLKENTALADALVWALEQMKTDGSYQKILAKWGVAEVPSFAYAK